MIGVTYPPTNRRAVRAFVHQLKMNYPVWLGTKATKALFDPGETLPFSVVIDREGKVRENIEGILFPGEFDEKVKPLLGRIATIERIGARSNNHHGRTNNEEETNRRCLNPGCNHDV